MNDGPVIAYRDLIAAGEIAGDPAQELAAEKLQSLHNALRNYRPSAGIGGWKARLGLARRNEDPPQGLYIFGPVGRGKSMLMDLFFDSAPVTAKRRVHFNAFMLDVHDRLHRIRTGARGESRKADLIAPLADEIAEAAWLLCFDEFQVTNIADAMILGRLFEALFERGVVVVATSNTAPDDLYAGGLQRDRFLPFIAILKARLDLLMLDGGRDYRLDRIEGRPVFHTPLGAEATAALEQVFADLTDDATGAPRTFDVQGRDLTVHRAAKGVAFFSFAELCERPLGAADYLEIARRFHTVIVDGIPVFDADRRNESRRFMTFIDSLYEARTRLFCAAAAAPPNLQRDGRHATEFERTSSRLIEMQGDDYVTAARA